MADKPKPAVSPQNVFIDSDRVVPPRDPANSLGTTRQQDSALLSGRR